MENETQPKSALQRPKLQSKGTESEMTVPAAADATEPRAVEIGGPAGPEPTRYGDWERRGRCIDF